MIVQIPMENSIGKYKDCGSESSTETEYHAMISTTRDCLVTCRYESFSFSSHFNVL
jgi:hypothetical protein